MQESAHSVGPHLHPDRALRLGGVDDLCALRDRDGHDSCSLHVGFRLLPRDQAIPTHDGLGITIRVPSPMTLEESEHNLAVRVQLQQSQRPANDWHDDPHQEQPESTHPAASGFDQPPPEDATSFMARSLSSLASHVGSSSVSSSTSTSSSYDTMGRDEVRRSIVFCLDGRTAHIDAPWDDADRLWDICARVLDIQENDIMRVLHVDFRPTDLANEGLECLLLQRRHEEPTVNFLRLCLQDVNYAPDHHGPRTRIARKSTWIPRRSNRASIIRLAGFEGHCYHEPWRCSVWINGVLFSDDMDVVELNNGDYVEIDIPSHPEESAVICADNQDESQSDIHNQTDADETPEIEDMSSMQLGILHDGRQCKLDNTSVVEGPDYVVSLVPPEAPGRPELQFGEHLDCLDALHHLWWLHSAVEIEEEGRVLYVSTWYTDGTRWPSCDASRPARLLSDPGAWADCIAEAWDDRVDPDSPLPPLPPHTTTKNGPLVSIWTTACAHCPESIYMIIEEFTLPRLTLAVPPLVFRVASKLFRQL